MSKGVDELTNRLVEQATAREAAEADSLIAKCGGTGSGANCGLKGSKGTEVWEKSALAWILAVGMTAGTSGPDAMLPIVTLMYLGGAFS